MSRPVTLKRGFVEIGEPYASMVLGAIMKGSHEIPSPGAARKLGEIAIQTNGFRVLCERPRSRAKGKPVIVPKNIRLIEEFTNSMVFEIGGKENGKRKKTTKKERHI